MPVVDCSYLPSPIPGSYTTAYSLTGPRGSQIFKEGDQIIFTYSVPDLVGSFSPNDNLRILTCSHAVSCEQLINGSFVPVTGYTTQQPYMPPGVVQKAPQLSHWLRTEVHPGDYTFRFTLDTKSYNGTYCFDQGTGHGDWVGIHSLDSPTQTVNHDAIMIPFNIYTSTLKPGEKDRVATRYSIGRSYCTICQFFKWVTIEIEVRYLQYNSLFGPGSPGYGWSMGQSYARVARETDPYNQSDPTVYLNYYDGTGSFDRWTINTATTPETYTPLYADMPTRYLGAGAVLNADGTYTLSFADLSKQNFAAVASGYATTPQAGRILSHVDANFNVLNYGYTDSAAPTRVMQIDDGEGRVAYFTYRSDGQPLTIAKQSPTGDHIVRFFYDGSNRISQVQDAANNSQYFTYVPGTNQLAARWDTRNNPANGASSIPMVAYTYVGGSGPYSDRISTEQHYDELLRTYSYQDAVYPDGTTGMAMTISEQDIKATTADHPASATRWTATAYNERDLPVQSWGPTLTAYPYGNTSPIQWRMQYADPNNPYLLTQTVDPNLYTTSMAYDSYGNMVTKVLGSAVATPDATNNTTTYEYGNSPNNSSPFLLTKINPPAIQAYGDGTPTVHSTLLGYDLRGNLASVTDAANQTVTITRNNLHPSGHLGAGTSDGRITSIQDRNNKTTTMAYSVQTVGKNAGNLASITYPSGSSATGLTMDYDSYDNINFVKDGLNHAVSYSWDVLQRLTQITSPSTNTFLSMAYNQDRLDGLTMPDIAGLPSNPSVPGSSGQNRTTAFVYDTPSRVTQVKAQNNISGATQSRVQYGFDGWSNLLSLKRQQLGVDRKWQFQYDVLDRTTQVQDPFNATPTTNEYQPYCMSYKQTTPRGVIRNYTMDSLCRMVNILPGDESNVVTYDVWGQVIQIVHLPSVASTSSSFAAAKYGQARYSTPNAAQTKNFLYDQLGRLKQVTFLPENKTIQYTSYDNEGNVLSVVDNTSGTSITTSYTYTSDYALLSVTRNGQIFNYGYDLAGRLTSLEYPASTGIIATYNWDIDSNLLGIEYASGATNLQSFSYGYDNSQSRTGCTDVNGFDSITTNWKYGYDWFSRLAGVTRNADLNLYSFDESDNRTQLQKTVGGVTSTFNYSYGADNRLTSRALAGGGTDTFSSDPDGNLTSVTGTVSSSYLWNNSDKLARVQTSAGSETNSYGAEGLRRSKEPNTLYYDSDSTAISDNATNPVSYIQGHQILGFQVGGVQYYYLPDVLGSIRHVVDSSGARKFSIQYDEFGSATINDQTGGSPSYLAGLCQQLTFVGTFGVRNETAVTGMYLMGQRWYDPSLGRFISQDPIGFNGGLNLYGYVYNAPTISIDPHGLQDPITVLEQVVELEPEAEKILEPLQPALYGWALGALGFVGAIGAAAMYNHFQPNPLINGTDGGTIGGNVPVGMCKGVNNPKTKNAVTLGNWVHYDVKNGGKNPNGAPNQLQAVYGKTDLLFTRRGQKGRDVEFNGGTHPSAYPGSTWPAGASGADFKPDTISGKKTFARDKKTGKIPLDTHLIPYKPDGTIISPIMNLPPIKVGNAP